MTRRGLLGGALGAAALTAVGCGSGSNRGTVAGAGISAADLTGQTVALAGPARRVVTIPMPAASMVVAVNGGPEVLIGMNPSSRKAVESGYLGEVFPELVSRPSDVAGEDFAPSVERILELEPDLVVQWGDRGAGIVAPLTNAGLTVAQLKYGTQEFLEQAATLYGELLGKRDRSDRMVSWMQERRRHHETTTAPTERTVLYFQAVAQGLKVAGRGQYNDFTTTLAGGANPAAELPGQAGIDREQVLAWNPEIILLGNFDPTVPADLYRDPSWATVEAVRARRVYKVPLGGYRWDPPNQESPLMWDWLAGLVARDEVPSDLPASIRTQYAFLYGSEPSDAQIAAVLQSTANRDSVGYAALGT